MVRELAKMCIHYFRSANILCFVAQPSLSLLESYAHKFLQV